MARRIRIVVGEGRTAQRGLLRFVLEGEGFDVVGEARSSADLSGAIEAQRPDVVVLDDGIGVTAVSMVHEVHPQAKVVLVWPSFVVPIGGDARVEPGKILRDLGPAVEHVMGVAAGLTAFARPDWVEKVRKDPATLRNKLLLAGAGAAAAATKRPSVTSLQKRGKRLHPTGRRSKQTDPEGKDVVPAPIILLPGAGSEVEPVLDISGGDVSDAGLVDEPILVRSEWNRRLGTLALSGAAAVSALVLALALGGGRVPASLVRGGGFLPPGVPGLVRPGSGSQGPFGDGSLGGSGYNPVPVIDEPAGGTNGGTDRGLVGGLAGPSTGGSDVPVINPSDGGTGGDGGTGVDGGSGGGGGGGGNGGGGNGGGGNGGGGNGGGGGGGNGGGGNGGGGNGGGGNGGGNGGGGDHDGGGGNGGGNGGGGDHDGDGDHDDDHDGDGDHDGDHHGDGDHDGDGDGDHDGDHDGDGDHEHDGDHDGDGDHDDDGKKSAAKRMPGKSAEHNPHGGPPSKLGLTPARGQGLGVAVTSQHSKPKHAHKH